MIVSGTCSAMTDLSSTATVTVASDVSLLGRYDCNMTKGSINYMFLVLPTVTLQLRSMKILQCQKGEGISNHPCNKTALPDLALECHMDGVFSGVSNRSLGSTTG